MSLDDPATIRAGARAFSERGCANCHGAPGVGWAKWSEGLRPDPPDLKKIVPNREPRELFWVIKNGIKMTGMPSFGLIGVPDQENLVDGRLPQEAPGCFSGGLQSLERALMPGYPSGENPNAARTASHKPATPAD